MSIADVDQSSEIDSPSQELTSLFPKHSSCPSIIDTRKERCRNDSGYVGSYSGSPNSQNLDNNLDCQFSRRPLHNQAFDSIFSRLMDWQQYPDASTSPADSSHSHRPRSTKPWEEKNPCAIMDGRIPQNDGNKLNIRRGWRHDELNENADLTSNACDQLGTREQPSHPQHGYLPSPKLARQSRLGEPTYTPQSTEPPSSSRSLQSFQYEPNRTPRPASDILGDMKQHGPQSGLPADETIRPPTTGDGNSTRKTSKRRKGDEETDEDDETQKAKRERDLVRNRLAASKCRAKKKEETRQTEEKARRLQAENAHLRAWVGQLQEEKLQLMDQVLALSDSSDTRMRGFLNQRAYNLVQSGNSIAQGSSEQSNAYNTGEGGLPASSTFNVPTAPAHSRHSSVESTQYFSQGNYRPDMQRTLRQTVDGGFDGLSLNSPTHTRGNSTANVHTTQQSPINATFGAPRMGPHTLGLSRPSTISIGNSQMRSLFRQGQHPAQSLSQFTPQYTGLTELSEVPQSSDTYAEALVNRLQYAIRGQERDQELHSPPHPP